MPNYHLIWEIDLDAANPTEAAQKARDIQLDIHSTANVFDVVNEVGEMAHIDLQEVRDAEFAKLYPNTEYAAEVRARQKK